MRPSRFDARGHLADGDPPTKPSPEDSQCLSLAPAPAACQIGLSTWAHRDAL